MIISRSAIFYELFLVVNKRVIIKKRAPVIMFILPITFIVQLSSGRSNIILILLGYIIENKGEERLYSFKQITHICLLLILEISYRGRGFILSILT